MKNIDQWLLNNGNYTQDQRELIVEAIYQFENIDIGDAQHPTRQRAISLMEKIVGVLGKPKVFDGENWYTIEDMITSALAEK